jgi:hypothetical protein
MFSIKAIVKPDYERYEGVRPINIYLLRLLFLLMVVFVASDSWSAILKLWSTNQLAGSPAEGMTHAFVWVILPIVALPWAYAFRTYVWPSKKNG